MAERWQQWMPFHIDRFRGSPEVQAMHPAARIGYLYLLSSSWQTDDCTVSSDPLDLATESGLGDELWAQHGGRILRSFKFENGRYRNAVVFAEWERARKEFEKNHGPKLTPEELSETKRIAGIAGAKARWQKDGKVPSKPSQKNGKRMANDGLQEQEHIQKDKVPSRDKRESDQRHVPFKLAIQSYQTFKGATFTWDASEAKALDLLLRAVPTLTLAVFQQCLNHRARSPGTPHGERPRVWLPNILKYELEPLNQFNKTGEANGTFKGKSGHSVDAATRAIQAFEDRAAADRAGDSEAGEAGHGGLLGLRDGSGEVRPSRSGDSNAPPLIEATR